MDEVMRRGKIECECGNVYYFESIYPQIKCLACGKMNDNNGEIIEEDAPIEE